MAINIRGGGTGKKPGIRSRTTRQSSSSRATKRSVTHKTKAETTTQPKRRSPLPQVSSTELKKQIKELEEIGKRRDKYRDLHKKAVADQAEAVARMRNTIPPKIMSNALGVSVQWIFTQQKMLNSGERRKPGRPKTRPTAETAKTTKRSTTTKKVNRKTTKPIRKVGRPKIRAK